MDLHDLPFTERIYAVVERIPPGRVATYGDVAAVIGHPRAARQVGFALARLTPDRAQVVPWQRVINAQGMVSARGDISRADEQTRRLEQEGVRFDAAGRCDRVDPLRRSRAAWNVASRDELESGPRYRHGLPGSDVVAEPRSSYWQADCRVAPPAHEPLEEGSPCSSN